MIVLFGSAGVIVVGTFFYVMMQRAKAARYASIADGVES